MIHQILDAGFLAHVGFCVEGQPFVVPTLYGCRGDNLYLHGSVASRMVRQLESGVAACVNITLVDGFVLARSAFHHSMNYRSVMAFGTAKQIADREAKIAALHTISEHLIRGRWKDVRPPSETELKATAVLEFVIEEASAKVRTGGPLDDDADYDLPVWAGVLPVELTPQPPQPDQRLRAGLQVPDYALHYTRSGRQS